MLLIFFHKKGGDCILCLDHQLKGSSVIALIIVSAYFLCLCQTVVEWSLHVGH